MPPEVKSRRDVRVHVEPIEPAARPIRLHATIETDKGLDACLEIAHPNRLVDALLFGGVDMAAELRVEPARNALRHARPQVVHAAAGAGVDLVDVPFPDLSDLEGLERETRARTVPGFTGKGAVHPKGVPVPSECFSRTAEEVERARRGWSRGSTARSVSCSASSRESAGDATRHANVTGRPTLAFSRRRP